jgi:hypothetical protein
MKEYKVVDVKGLTKKKIASEMERIMNEFAKEGWTVTAVTELFGGSASYIVLITFERPVTNKE